MESKRQLWGPELDQYWRNFDPRGPVSSRTKQAIQTFKHEYGVIPLDVLEERVCMLSIPGPGVPSTREQRGEMIRLLRNYLSISRQKILKYYYGFLCVRHLLHLLCLSILEEAGVLNGYLESLGLELGYNELTHAVARKVLKTVFQEKKGFGLEEVAWASPDHSSS
ncbi:hypothetical protein FRC09_018944, partial [Ceratobasidium sp. 395]